MVVYFDLEVGTKLFEITVNNFVPFNDEMTGFYPREVYLHPRNAELFYVKFPMHVCLMTLIADNPQVIDCQKVTQKIIPDDQWTVVVGLSTYVVVSPLLISEYNILGNNNTLLHNIKLQTAITFPLHYDLFLNTIVLSTANNKVIYYKLNKPVIDCLYYEMNAKSDEENNDEKNNDQ